MSQTGFDFSRFEAKESQNSFNFDEFLEKNKYYIGLSLLGVILVGLGVLIYKNQSISNTSKIEVLESTTEGENKEIIVEISGAVEKPGVYKMKDGERIEDGLISAGGLSANADRNWVEKNLNRAAKLTDGQKILVRSKEYTNQQKDNMSANSGVVYQTDTLSYSDSTEGKTNINEASLEMLDKLPGIGPVYGQKIVEQRPYSNSEELLTKKVIPKSTYEKIKDLITVY